VHCFIFIIFTLTFIRSFKKPPQMALQVAASIYAINGTSIGTVQGRAFSFATQSFLARPIDSGQTAVHNGVTCNSIIQVLPTGLTVNGTQYYTNLTVAQIVTASNA
jgi:hypothetical protein